MNTIYYTLDVFTQTAFQGAQVAVFPFSSALPESFLARLASEVNLSESVFVSPSETEKNAFKLRIFSPNGEVGFAGHPMLAVAHVLVETGQVKLEGAYTTISLEQNKQTIEVNISAAEGGSTFVQFTLQSSAVIDRYTPPGNELASILSIEERHIDHMFYHTRMASDGVPYLIVPLTSQQAVEDARFDLKAWGQSTAPAMAAQEILLFSGKTKSNDSNFHARLVGPSIGLHEDPPVGSVLPAFAGYLASHDNVKEGTYSFAIDRGTVDTRRSLLNLEMDVKKGRPITLRVGGSSVLISKSELLIKV